MTRIPPRPALRPRRFLAAWIVTVVIAVACAAWMATRHPRFKSWRATQLAEQAMVALEAGDSVTAQNKAAAAFQLAPRNFTAIRSAARVTASQNDPQALTFYQSLVDSGVADGEDRLAFASAALNGGAFDLFEENIRLALPELPEGDVRAERLLGRYALLNGDFAAATAAFREVSAARPDSAEAKLELAAALLATPELSAQRSAPPLVEAAIDAQPAVAARGLGMLAAASGLPADTRLDAIERLLGLENIAFEDRLEALRLKIAASPGSRSAIVAEVVRSATAETSAHRALIARWLVHLGENSEAVAILPREMARTRMDWFLIWLDATAGLGRWGEIEAALTRSDVALPSSVRELFLGRALTAQGRTSGAVHYEKAIAEAGGDLDRLLYLAGYFHRIGESSLAERALNRLTEDPSLARTAYQALVGIHRQRQDTESLIVVLERMQRRWPGDPVVANDLRYLYLLTGKNIAQSAAEARAAAGSEPTNLPFQFTHALALLREDRAAEAGAIFDDSNLQLAQLLPHQRAIFAAILMANGDTMSAEGVARLIDPRDLLPEEAAMLRSESD